MIEHPFADRKWGARGASLVPAMYERWPEAGALQEQIQDARIKLGAQNMDLRNPKIVSGGQTGGPYNGSSVLEVSWFALRTHNEWPGKTDRCG